MTAKSESENLTLRLWRQVYQIYNLLKRSQDQVLEEYGLTAEQYGLLMVVDYLGGPTRITDIAQWLERSANSVSMIVDRMVKAGLVRRTRDRTDRRVVWVTATSKAEAALKPSNVAILEFVNRIFQPLSPKDKRTLIDLLGTPKYEILKYLNPGADIREMKRAELVQPPDLEKWLKKHRLPSFPQAKRQGGKKRP